MEFSVVEVGYDRDQVDSCLEDLAERLTRMVVCTEAAEGSGAELDAVRDEALRLRDLLETARPEERGPSYRTRRLLAIAEEEAAQILTRARAELAAAQEDARRIRDRVYAEAVQARRDFEAALHARRIRARQVDEILRDVPQVPGDPVPADWDEAATAAPGQPQSGSPRITERSTAQV
jgi:hypothetical protein